MQTIGATPVPETEPPRPDVRRAIIGLALVVAIAALLLLFLGNDRLPSDPTRWSPLQVATRFNELYEAGEVEAFQAMFSPDAAVCLNESCSEQAPFDSDVWGTPFRTAHESQYLAATGGTLGAECVADGAFVQCVWHQSNLLFEIGDIEPRQDTQTFRVEDGLITEYKPGYRFNGVMHDDRVEQNQYSKWVEEHYPLEHGYLFEDQLMLVFTEEARTRHLDLIQEYAMAHLG